MIFFFKQKTAYEMRISDCSSDVCSSDLDPLHPARHQAGLRLPQDGCRAEENRLPQAGRQAELRQALLGIPLQYQPRGRAAGSLETDRPEHSDRKEPAAVQRAGTALPPGLRSRGDRTSTRLYSRPPRATPQPSSVRKTKHT